MSTESEQGVSPELSAVSSSSAQFNARYRCEGYRRIEDAKVFQRAWLCAGLGYRVAKPGAFMTVEHGQTSIVLLRGDDGVLRGFHNTCQHRGTRLLEGEGRCHEVQCPYHGWVYSQQGALVHAPGIAGFEPTIGSDRRHLKSVRVAERLGFVWYCLDDEARPIEETIPEALEVDLNPYQLEEMRPIEERAWTLDCNWKAVLDNATESYHLAHVHGQSVHPMTSERPVFDSFGDHYRLTLPIANYGWRRWLDRYTYRGGPYTARQQEALHKYVFFPNLLINAVPCHLTVFQVWPITAKTCRFFYGFYGRSGGSLLERARAHATWLASRLILEEDKRILDAFQRGIQSSGSPDPQFHEDEEAVAHYHATLDRWMGTV